MKKFLTCRTCIFMWAVIVVVVYGLVCSFFYNVDVLIYIRSFEVWIAAAATLTTWPVARRIWNDPERSDTVSSYEIYSLGTVLILSGTFVTALWLLLWRLADEPRWMVDSWINGLMVIWVSCGIMLQLLSPGIEHGEIPRKTVRVWITAVVFSILVAFCGIMFNKFFMDLSLLLRPYLAEEPYKKPVFYQHRKSHSDYYYEVARYDATNR
jgi:hypothetical protein